MPRNLPIVKDAKYVDKKPADLAVHQKIATQYGGSVGGHPL